MPNKGLIVNCSAETLQNSKRVSIVSGALDVKSFSKSRGERLATNMAPKNTEINNKKIFLWADAKILKFERKKNIDAKVIAKVAKRTPLVALYTTINNPTTIPVQSIPSEELRLLEEDLDAKIFPKQRKKKRSLNLHK